MNLVSFLKESLIKHFDKIKIWLTTIYFKCQKRFLELKRSTRSGSTSEKGNKNKRSAKKRNSASLTFSVNWYF